MKTNQNLNSNKNMLCRFLRVFGVILLSLLCCNQIALAQLNEQGLKEACKYESHSLGGSGYPFHGATYFKDKVYAVQIFNAVRGVVRVCALNNDAETGELSFGSYVDFKAGHMCLDAELIEWYGNLVVFWNNGHFSLNYSENGQDFQAKNIKISSDRHFCDFAVVKYKNKLCLLYSTIAPFAFSGKIHIIYTEDADLSNAKWKYYGTVKNGNMDNISFKGNKYTLPNHVSGSRSDAWDAESWIGNNAKGENSEMLVVGRVKNGNGKGIFEAFTYEGNLDEDSNDSWNPYISQESGSPNAFYLKLIQASVKGVTEVNTMPLQFIYASDKSQTSGEVFFKEFLPTNKAFSSIPQKYCDIPYGYFGVTTSNILEVDSLSNPTNPHRLYRQKLHLIRGNGPGYHWHDNNALSLSSNIIKTSNLSINNPFELLSDPKLRPLITFEGVIEGPPPTIVNSNEWYDSLFNYFSNVYSASSVTFGRFNEKVTTDKKGVSISTSIGIGPSIEGVKKRFCIKAEMAGYQESKVRYKISYEYEDFAADVNRLHATAFYTVPNIERYDYEVWNCDREKGRVTTIIPMTDFRIMSYVMFPIPLNLSEAPFSISDPANINDWMHRDCLKGAENIPAHQKATMGFCIDLGLQRKSLEEDAVTTTSYSKSFQVGTDIDLPFFSLELFAGLDFESTTETTIGKSLSFTLNCVPLSTVPQGVKPVEQYSLNLYILTNEKTDLLENYYYPAMMNKTVRYGGYDFPMLIKGEKPFVIAWQTYPYALTEAEITRLRLMFPLSAKPKQN